MQHPPKKPKMSKERYFFLENIRTNDPRHNAAILEDYPSEWKDFNIAYKWYNYKVPIVFGNITGQ